MDLPFRLGLLHERLQFEVIGLLHVEHGERPHDGMAPGLRFVSVNQAALLILLRLVVFVLLHCRAPVLVVNDPDALLAFADLSARFPDLVVGAPAVVRHVPLPGHGHQVEGVAALVGPARCEVARDLRTFPRFPGQLERRFLPVAIPQSSGPVRSGEQGWFGTIRRWPSSVPICSDASFL